MGDKKEDTIRGLNRLREYLLSTRGVGHTRTMIEGAKYSNGVVVVLHSSDYAYTREMRKRVPEAVTVGWPEISVVGLRLPLVMDNGGLLHMLSDALEVIDALQKENEGLRNGGLRAKPEGK